MRKPLQIRGCPSGPASCRSANMHQVGNAEGNISPTLRGRLEQALEDLARVGAIDATGERDLRIRLTPEGKVRWFECVRRKPASEFDASG